MRPTAIAPALQARPVGPRERDGILAAMAILAQAQAWLDERDRWPAPARVGRLCDIAFAISAIAAAAALLALGSGMTFFQDEWRFVDVEGPFGSPHDWVKPHNEHWSTTAFFLYRVVVNVVGLSSYLPYLAVLLLLHVVAATGLYVLVRRQSGPVVALGAGVLVLLLGAGYQNLFWAFQIGFVGSTAAGLWALVAFEHPGRRASVAAMVLVLVGLMASSIGLIFLIVVGVELIADPERRRRVAWLVPPAAAFAAWYVGWGRHAVSDARSPFTVEAITDVPRFVWAGVRGAIDAASTGALTRVSATLSNLPLAAVGAAVLLTTPIVWLASRGRRISPRTLGAVAGLVAIYALIGLFRGHYGEAQATRSRYLYDGVILVLLAVSGLLGRRLAPGAPGLTRPSTVALATLLSGLLVLGLVNNAAWLVSGRRDWTNRSNELRAYIALLDRLPAGAVNLAPNVEWNIPEPDRMRRLIATYGSPLTDALLPGVVPSPTELDRDRALFRLVGGGFVAERRPSRDPGAPVRLAALSGATVAIDGACLVAEPLGDPVRATLRLPDGGAVELSTAAPAAGRAYLHRAPTAQRPNAIEIEVGPGPTSILTPEVGDGDDWLVTVELPPTAGPSRLCPTMPAGG